MLQARYYQIEGAYSHLLGLLGVQRGGHCSLCLDHPHSFKSAARSVARCGCQDGTLAQSVHSVREINGEQASVEVSKQADREFLPSAYLINRIRSGSDNVRRLTII